MEGVFWYGLGIITGMAALPWIQQLTERARRALLELDEPTGPRAAPDERHRF